MNDTRGVRRARRRLAPLVASAALSTGLFACYWLQPDWMAPVTLVPAWCWCLLGFLLLGPALVRPSGRAIAVVILVVWVLFAGIHVEEAGSLLRGVISTPLTDDFREARTAGQAVRVVSLNCYGSAASIGELQELDPDIVLLQESPARDQLEMACRELFGDAGTIASGGDTSMILRGRLESVTADEGSPFIHANVELPTGQRVEVFSVRFSPPVSRLDVYAPGFWRDHYEKRQVHRTQAEQLMGQFDQIPDSSPLIVGGDFNAPGGDGALVGLGIRLIDTFRVAGRGWGNTGTNDYPLFRVDQVWASPHFTPVTVEARRTAHSDHRLVVCDLLFAPSATSTD